MGESHFPFKVGQLAESKSFLSGYRGSWFRCKIVDIGSRRRETLHALEFYDFPDEKVRWTKLYQKPVGGPRLKEMKRQIMVRPSFPPIFRESQMPDVNSITEVVVIVNDVWKVGDLVDWWTDNCYWTARLTEILGDGKARERVNRRCARLIYPGIQATEGSQNYMVRPLEEVTKNAQPTAGLSFEYDASFSSRISTGSLPSLDNSERHAKRPLSPAASKETHALETKMGFDGVDVGSAKPSYSDSVSSSHIRDATAEMPGTDAGNKNCENSGSSKKMRDDRDFPLNSSFSDTVEAAIIDYEELVNRVKWIKGILQLGTVPSKTERPKWKFVEHRSSSFPK